MAGKRKASGKKAKKDLKPGTGWAWGTGYGEVLNWAMPTKAGLKVRGGQIMSDAVPVKVRLVPVAAYNELIKPYFA